MAKARIRVLIAKPGLDGHSVGAKVICRALRDAGMEVIYTGLRQTPDQIVEAALQEDVDIIGLSVLSGAHRELCERVLQLLKQNQAQDIPVVVGGIVPREDIAELRILGIQGVFGPGTPLNSVVDFISQLAARAARQNSGFLAPSAAGVSANASQVTTNNDKE